MQVSVDSKATSQDCCLTANFFEEMDERTLDGTPLLDMPAPATADFGAQVHTNTAFDASVIVLASLTHWLRIGAVWY